MNTINYYLEWNVIISKRSKKQRKKFLNIDRDKAFKKWEKIIKLKLLLRNISDESQLNNIRFSLNLYDNVNYKVYLELDNKEKKIVENTQNIRHWFANFNLQELINTYNIGYNNGEVILHFWIKDLTYTFNIDNMKYDDIFPFHIKMRRTKYSPKFFLQNCSVKYEVPWKKKGIIYWFIDFYEELPYLKFSLTPNAIYTLASNKDVEKDIFSKNLHLLFQLDDYNSLNLLNCCSTQFSLDCLPLDYRKAIFKSFLMLAFGFLLEILFQLIFLPK